jgi:hypothetical protein
MQHNLKIDRIWFEALVDGRKKAEVRRADRAFSAGDDLLLYVPGAAEGALVKVTHVLNVSDVRGLDCSAPIAVLSIDDARVLSGEALNAQMAVGDFGTNQAT